MEGGGSNNDAWKNKSRGSLEAPQNSTPWKEASLKALNPLPVYGASVGNEITPFSAAESSSSYCTPGPEAARGQLVIVQSLVAGGQREAGEREGGLTRAPNQV